MINLGSSAIAMFHRKFSQYYSKHVGGDNRPVFLPVDTFPALHVLERNAAVIGAELEPLLRAREALPDLTEVDPAQESIGSRDGQGRAWKVFYLSTAGVHIKENMARCPQTSRLVLAVPNMAQAFFSILEPGRSVPAHCGPYMGYLRYHLALVVPDDNPPTIRVRDQTYCWKTGESVLFDDTWEHEVTNNSSGLRAVLILDVLRPLPRVAHIVNWLYIFGGGRLVYGKGVVERNLRRYQKAAAHG